MSARLSLLFPYACAVLVIGLIALDRGAAQHVVQAAWLRPPAPAARGTAEMGTTTSTGVPHHLRGLDGIPAPLYYSSIAVVLLLSFGLIEWRTGRQTQAPATGGRPRFDLLTLPWLRAFLTHPATRPLLQSLVVAWFVLIIAAGLFGNQLPTKNIAPMLTWTVWWCGLILLILYAGKAWCYVCPWDAIAGWAERLRFRTGATLGADSRLSLGLRWPRKLRNIWPATMLFIGLTWIELGVGVTMNPRATAWLGLGMLGLAFVSAFIFERKSFCRYGCLVGRISGLYALFAPIEVRAKDRAVCRTCRTRSCYKGNEHGEACPTFQYLGSMDQNTYCISCMECVKTCEAGNVALQVRPWGEDLFQHHRPRADEAYLALLMLSLAGFHGLTMTGAWDVVTRWLQAAFGLGAPAAFSLGMAGIMIGPIVLYAALVALSRMSARVPTSGYRDHFIRYAYALLPIALFYHLAHNSEHLLVEGQRLVALVSDPFGYEWNLFGTARWTLHPVVSVQTLWGIQILLVLVGHVYSLCVARRAASALFSDTRAAFRSQVPMLAAMIMFSIMSLWLLKQPMAMRMSWM
ncbi:MAG: 4Fe-4S binding protein [Candidatus Binatia bacterium]